jgi:hypothetical protein
MKLVMEVFKRPKSLYWLLQTHGDNKLNSEHITKYWRFLFIYVLTTCSITK